LVWDKEWIGPGGTTGLRPSYELVALLTTGDFSIADRGLPDVQRFKWSSIKPNGHPAEKPVSLMRWLVDNSTKPAATVMDPFMGSGTTGIAAINSGRSFIGIEQDPEWFRLACERIENAQRQNKLFPEKTREEAYEQHSIFA
jgi:DNA modification methylase